MSRLLNTATLDQAAIDYAGLFMLPDRRTPGGKNWATGPERIRQDFYAFDFKDEFDYVYDKIQNELGKNAKARLSAIAKETFTPRDEKTLEKLLKEKLACDLNGNHIQGCIGSVVVGGRVVGRRITRHGILLAEWPVYAGEEEERAIGNVRAPGEDGLGADPIPPPDTIFPDETAHMGYGLVMALNTNISIAMAQAMMDAGPRTVLQEGTAAGILGGYTASQPADPNVAIAAQTLLFTLVLTDPNPFGTATDAAPGALATAAAITDDSSADATGTLAWLRGSSSNDAATILNSHIDGSAGTASADFIFNTLSIVSGAVVSMSSWTVTLPQGPTAT